MSCLVPDSTSNYRGVEHFMKFLNFLKMVLVVKMVSSHPRRVILPEQQDHG